jgi:hypothetical protein
VVWDFDFVVGVIGTIAGYPFDTVKVCLQMLAMTSIIAIVSLSSSAARHS